MNANYDWGLDTMTDATERIVYENFWRRYPNHPEYAADPSGDNWTQLPIGVNRLLDTVLAEQYEGVNGTQGNFASEDGHFPDTEDLNKNGILDRVNNYFEYELPLNTKSNNFQKLITGTGGDHWYQIRIPLSEYNRKIGAPTFTNVEGVRLWVTGAGKPLLFRIVDLNLVGSQWEKRVKTDTSFDLSVVNYEDDPLYSMPDGNLCTKDLTRPDQNILSNEQSMNIIVKNLPDHQYKEVVRYMTDNPLDMFNYHTLKMFVHGETGENTAKGYHRFAYADTAHYDAEMFLHFGDDTSNYYEYRAPVHAPLPSYGQSASQAGWDSNEVIINFSYLTSLKASRDSTNGTAWMYVPGGWPGAIYRIVGNPRLDRIQFVSVGIENPGNKGATILNGELWIDELRLTDVDDTHGWAYKVDANIKLADIGTIAFSLSQRDPYFHGLEDHFGTRNTTRTWSLSAGFALEKLLPDTWNGSVLSVSYSHSESSNKPLYVPGTDVLVDKAAERLAADTSSTAKHQDIAFESEDFNVSDSYAIPTLKLNIPGKSWLVTETINKMTFGYNYTKSHQRNSSTEFADAWSWSANFRYGTQFNPNNYLTLGSLKFFFTPQQLNFGASLNRSQSQSKTRTQDTPNDVVRNLSAQRSMDFGWQFFSGGLFDLGVAYSVNISSILTQLETDKYQNQRPFTSILSDIFLSDRLVDFGTDQSYNQSITLNTKLTVPQLLMLDKILTPNMRYAVNYSWINNIQAGPIGRSAAWGGGPSFSLDVLLKPITDVLWPVSQPPAPAPADTLKKGGSFDLFKQFNMASRILFKNTLFDFEKFNFSFTQTNNSQNNGVYGNTGFANIFARSPFQSSQDENGPKFLYQFGLMSDPNGELVLKAKPTFPFFYEILYPGIRAPNANITDAYSQNNQVAMHTSRPLWDGATLQLDWKVGWTFTENTTGITDSLGRVMPSQTSSNVSGDKERSFISLPPVLIFKVFHNSLETVNDKYNALKNDPNDTRDPAAKLSQAFEQGLEAFPWLTKILGEFAPRANWSIHWDGLENISFLKSFASRISLDHAYTSSYKSRWQTTPVIDQTTGETSLTEQITSQTISYGFSPLLGLNITFKDFIKGSLSATFRYGATTSYDLVPSSQNVSQSSTSDISVTGTYSRQGFEIPFFGVSLMNNIDLNFTYGYSHNARLLFDFNNFQKDGLPMEGSGRTTMEPRIRYTLSERVTASVYYRYTRIAPDDGGSQIPGSTTNEGGLDVHVSDSIIKP